MSKSTHASSTAPTNNRAALRVPHVAEPDAVPRGSLRYQALRDIDTSPEIDTALIHAQNITTLIEELREIIETARAQRVGGHRRPEIIRDALADMEKRLEWLVEHTAAQAGLQGV